MLNGLHCYLYIAERSCIIYYYVLCNNALWFISTLNRVAALIQSGAEIGLQFTNKCPVFPNTLKAHALMEYSKEVENGQKQNDVAEKLFKVNTEASYSIKL